MFDNVTDSSIANITEITTEIVTAIVNETTAYVMTTLQVGWFVYIALYCVDFWHYILAYHQFIDKLPSFKHNA